MMNNKCLTRIRPTGKAKPVMGRVGQKSCPVKFDCPDGQIANVDKAKKTVKCVRMTPKQKQHAKKFGQMMKRYKSKAMKSRKVTVRKNKRFWSKQKPVQKTVAKRP